MTNRLIQDAGRNLIAACLAGLVAVAATAQSEPRANQAMLASADDSVRIHSLSGPIVAAGERDRGVQTCVDLAGVDSWDSLDDPDNIVIDVDITSDLKLTGIAWDVGLESVGGSWLSDASVLVSNSDGVSDPNGIILAPGFDVSVPGDQEFTSGGVVLFSSEGLPDVEPNNDGLIRLQFFEFFDDVADAIDTRWRNAADPVTCPGIWLELAQLDRPGGPGNPPDVDPSTVPLDEPLALIMMIFLLGTAGMVVLRSGSWTQKTSKE